MNDIDKIITVLNTAGSTAVTEYSNWFFVNAIVWFLILSFFGLICLYNAYKVGARLSDHEDKTPAIIMLGIAVTFLLCAASNITNIINPEGYAIHYLIKDIRD